MIKWLVTALVVGLALVLWRMAAAAKQYLPKAGDDAPAFELPDQDGQLRGIGEYRGRWLVLYFYPRDDTSGCTEQAAGFRDSMERLAAFGAAVCGVSVDDSESHADFARKYQLPFTLLADRGGATAARYGSLWNFGLIKLAKRNTFLIDPRGKVARVYLGVNPARNAAQVIEGLILLQKR
jgi:thioredoxin-dependent peroxiredoxin